MKIILCALALMAPVSAMEKVKHKKQKLHRRASMPELKDLEAAKQTACCSDQEPEVKQSCTRMKVALITGATTLISTAVTAATILLVQHTQPPQQ